MTLFFTYYSPTTPYATGWSVGLGNSVVRLGRMGPLNCEAQLGSVGISSLALDDPSADVGHSSDAIAGLKQVAITETAAPTGRKRIFTGYTGDRRYSRGLEGDDDSLRLGVNRRVDVTLVDINSFLSFRVFQESDANRPAETDVARVTWLLTASLLDSTLYDEGLVSTASPVAMDAVDYRGQRPADLLNDCSQQSGKNHFAYYDETSGHFALFYDFNDSLVNLSTLQVSNVEADVDNVTTFAPAPDAQLTRDPSRVAAGVYMPYSGGAVYRTLSGTAATFGWRDQAAPSVNVKSATKANARADRYLAENSTEDEVLTLTLFLPRANVNDWREGEAARVKFSHLPGFETYRYVRAVKRSVSQQAKTDQFYTVEYECTPMEPSPSGAFSVGSGAGGSTSPTLPTATTEANLLLCIVVIQRPTGPSSYGETGPTFHDADVTGALQTWTQHDWHAVYDTTAAIGPPGPISFGIFSRRVAAGESTTTPVNVRSPGGASDQISVFLWELARVGDPVDVDYLVKNGDPAAGGLADGGTFSVGSALEGWVVGGFAVQMVDYGGKPTVVASAGTDVQNCSGSNDPAVNATHGWTLPWVWIGQSSTGGPLAASWTPTYDPSYDHEGAVGSAIVIPGMTKALPTIPYPANVVSGS